VAATIVGAGQGTASLGEAFPAHIYAERLKRSPRTPGNCTVCVVACASLALFISGLVFLNLSRSNSHDVLVADYNGVVSGWNISARAEFGGAHFNVSAQASLNARTPVVLVQSDTKDFDLHDAEDGVGVDAYEPLKYVASLDFPADHLNASSTTERSAWEVLPARADAVSVTFNFSAFGLGTSAVQLGSLAVPLAFSEARHPQSEYPDNECRAAQHGVWRRMRCHVAYRLTRVCVVVEQDGSSSWRLSQVQRNGTAAAASLPPLHGCDPLTSWDPATYARDYCWGPWPDRRRCGAEDRQRLRVEVTVRSAADPFLRMEELTRDRFDFGPSAASQWAAGVAFMVVGGALAFIPVMRLFQIFRPCRRQGQSEERTGLSSNRA